MNLEEFKLLYSKFNNGVLHAEDANSPEFDAYIDAYHNDRECSAWVMVTILNERQFEYQKHCCLEMAMQISTPNTMPDGEDDHDIIMNYSEVFDEYGIPIYDGGTSVMCIKFCPWCGTKLPDSKRDDWFRELGDVAYGNDLTGIPEEYKSDKWWRKSNNP
jgi:hypothetical protein